MVGLLQWRGWSCTAFAIALVGCGPAVDVDDDGSSSDADDATGNGQDGSANEADSANDEATGTPMPFDLGDPSSALSGEYLFALAAVIDPLHPFQFHARVVAEDDASGGATLEILLQPLALDVLSTNAPRTPVGDPIPIVIGVGPNGEFGAELPELNITGAANPITGSEIVATVGLRGSTRDGDVWCGDAYGTVTQPLMLDLVGSTFSFTRLDGNVLPDPVIAFCQR